jgi:Ring finger domain
MSIEQKWVCAICLCDDKDNQISIILRCSHRFHSNCYFEWDLERTKPCLICNKAPYPTIAEVLLLVKSSKEARNWKCALDQIQIAMQKAESNSNESDKAILGAEFDRLQESWINSIYKK